MATSLEDKIRKLPPKLRNEVEDFVSFLSDQDKRTGSGHLRLDWMGMVKNVQGTNVVTLQKQILK